MGNLICCIRFSQYSSIFRYIRKKPLLKMCIHYFNPFLIILNTYSCCSDLTFLNCANSADNVDTPCLLQHLPKCTHIVGILYEIRYQTLCQRGKILNSDLVIWRKEYRFCSLDHYSLMSGCKKT